MQIAQEKQFLRTTRKTYLHSRDLTQFWIMSQHSEIHYCLDVRPIQIRFEKELFVSALNSTLGKNFYSSVHTVLYSSQNLQEQKHKEVESALQHRKLNTFNQNFPMFFSLKWLTMFLWSCWKSCRRWTPDWSTSILSFKPTCIPAAWTTDIDGEFFPGARTNVIFEDYF